MTALQIARAHCADWQTNGSCLGAIIEDDGAIRRCVPKTKCALSAPGQRCRYFEECVAPMARSIENPRAREEFTRAVRDYRVAAKLPGLELRRCPACGRAIYFRQRFCRVCAAARNRANQRTWARKRRDEMSKVKPVSPLANQEVAQAA